MIADEQMPVRFLEVIKEQVSIYDKGSSIQVTNTIPDTSYIPIQDPSHWLRIPNVICVYVDMMGSTRLSAEAQDRSTAGAYQLFTGTAVRLFSAFGSPYIDVRGDGVFALFNQDQPYTALAAAVTFKTFAKEVCVPNIKDKTAVEVGSHIGIDQKTVLVRKIGLKRYGSRTDRQNEVWAGKPVNMAAKLASLSDNEELLASSRFFSNLKDEHVLLSCGCPGGTKASLWSERDLSQDKRFDFQVAYCLKTNWCRIHGREYCEAILALD
jgi:class 3 adenylate cyclase